MKKVISLVLLIVVGIAGYGQQVNNPSISIKPIGTLSITKVVTTDSTTSVFIKIVNSKQLAPFSIKTHDLYIRPVSDPNNLKLIRSVNAPFAPVQHTFTALNEVFEFTLVFKALPKGTKYFDLMENNTKREFYIQGIVLDAKLNEMIARGFDCYSKGDGFGALKAFTEMANADLYFEYGLAYFNIIYLLTSGNRIDEAQVWYDKWKQRFFYDKALLEKEMFRLGISQKLK